MILSGIRERVESGRDRTVDILRSLVDVNSFWGNVEGVNHVGDLVLDAVPRSMKRELVKDTAGIHHHILTSPAKGDHPILMVGHLDTVFPQDIESTPFVIRDGLIIGPGTADMKGGIVVIVRALQILEEMELLSRIPVKCLINGDEEIGSPFSSQLVQDLGSTSSYGLVFECGGLDHEIVVGRRGVTRFNLIVTGQARHAGVKEGPKASAIVELAHLVLALEELNDLERGISVNVGVIRGGTANNVVPDHAEATFEFRYRDTEAEKEVLKIIENSVAFVQTPGCGAILENLHRRPCMVSVPGTADLVSILQAAALELGKSVRTQVRGGASDGNYLSEIGVPVIDGLGPVGDMDHSPNEYIVESSLSERIELTALLLVRLAGLDVDQETERLGEKAKSKADSPQSY